MHIAVAKLASVAALLACALTLPAALLPKPGADARLIPLCSAANVDNCVIDGDTIHWQGQRIRLQDIDAPEIFTFKCAGELALGTRATLRLQGLLGTARITLLRAGARDRDRYGRRLRIVSNQQGSLGAILVAEGLARQWDGARHGWCG
jgi:endonuclease YncB( thermonuclease family)